MLPDGWVNSTIGEVCSVVTGKTPPTVRIELYDGEVNFYKPGDLKCMGPLAPSTDRISEEGLEYAPILPPYSVLVSCIGILGKSGYILTKSSCNQQINAILPSDIVDPIFTYHWTRTITPWLDENSSATTVSIINKGKFERAPIDLPPLPEQRRIVAKLDALTARIARARAELDRVEALAARLRDQVRDAALHGELTRPFRGGADADWPNLPLSSLGAVVTGSTPPSAEKASLFGGNMPFIKPTDLDAGYNVSSYRESLSDEGAARARVVPPKSTLVTCIGATIAKTGLVRMACAFNQQINAVIPNTDVVDPHWLYWAITSPSFRQTIIENSSATTLPIINKGRFEALELAVPPLNEQRVIVDFLEAIFARVDCMETETARVRALLDRLESAILAKAFRGELVPQDPNDEPASALLERIRTQRAAAPKAKRGRLSTPKGR